MAFQCSEANIAVNGITNYVYQIQKIFRLLRRERVGDDVFCLLSHHCGASGLPRTLGSLLNSMDQLTLSTGEAPSPDWRPRVRNQLHMATSAPSSRSPRPPPAAPPSNPTYPRRAGSAACRGSSP